MGNIIPCSLLSSSSSSNPNHNSNSLTQEQQDIKWLGSQVPFGDDEIRLLYNAYMQHQQQQQQQQQQTNILNNNTNININIQSNDGNDEKKNIPNDQNQQQQQQQYDFLKGMYRFCYSHKVMMLRQQQQSAQQFQSQQSQKWANDEEADIAITEETRLLEQDCDIIMDIVVNKILPPQFSQQLYQSVFLPDGMKEKLIQQQQQQQEQTPNNNNNTSNTNNNFGNKNDNSNISNSSISTLTMTTTTTTIATENNITAKDTTLLVSSVVVPTTVRPPIMDEYTRKTFLESYFRGLAVTSRRGSRAAIKAMFMTCQEIQSTTPTSLTTCSNTSPPPPPPFSSSSSLTPPDATSSANSARCIRAIEMIDMGYRLALATAFLQCNDFYQNQDEDDKNINDNDNTTTTTTLDRQDNDDSTNNETVVHEQQRTNNNDTTSTWTSRSSSRNLGISYRERYIPSSSSSFGKDGQRKYPSVLKALANSLLERKHTRRRRLGIPHNPSANGNKVVVDDDDTVELEDVFDWMENVTPLFGSILPTFMHAILFPTIQSTDYNNNNNNSSTSTMNGISNTARTSYMMPSVPPNSSDFFQQPNSPLLFTIGCLSSSLSNTGGTPYHRLYASSVDGLSFNRLMNAILGYSGPTLFIIRAVKNVSSSSSNNNNNDDEHESIFGAFTNSTWKESKDFYGQTDCFLYQLSPTTAVYRPTGNNTNFMYCNSNARSRGYDQQAHGIGFGGTVHQPRFFIDESFENCVASSRDLTFENGNLLPVPTTTNDDNGYGTHNPNSSTTITTNQSYFDIDTLEVWGVGNVDTLVAGLESRSNQRDMANAAIQRARKVDKAQFLDDLRSGLMDNKTFKHRAEIDGRADCDVDARYNQMKSKF